MSQIRPVNPRLEYFEDALHQTGINIYSHFFNLRIHVVGWGLYYQFLVGFTAANLFSNGLALLCIHFALPLSACDTVLSSEDIINIHVSFTIGKAVGGFILSSISDNTGKKCMISKSLIIIFASSFVCAFSHNMYTLYMAALFLGSGLQANIITSKIHLAEILPMRQRGFYLVLPDLFWTVGYFITAVFLYFLGTNNPNPSEHQGMDMRLTSWRIIFAIGGGLSIAMGCTSALLEMSPRYLLFKRRIVTANLVLKQFYAINRSKYSETFNIHSQQLYELVSDYNINIDPEPVGVVQQFTIMVKVMLRMLKILTKLPFVKIAALLSLIKMPLFFGTAGLNVFLAQHLKFDNRSKQVVGRDFIHVTLNNEENCTLSFDQNKYHYFFVIGVNILFGQILLLLIIDRIGRKFPIFAGLTACSLACIMLAFNENFMLAVVISSMFIIGYTLVESTISVAVIESFPTAIRGTAAGVVYFYSCIVSCLIYCFLDMSRQNFLTILGAFMLGTSVISCFVPDLSRRPMIE